MITIYGTDDCGGCQQAARYFEFKEIEYQKKDIQSEDAKDFIHKNNISRVIMPIIDTGQGAVVGYNIEALAKLA